LIRVIRPVTFAATHFEKNVASPWRAKEYDTAGYPVFTLHSLPLDEDLLERLFGEEVEERPKKRSFSTSDSRFLSRGCCAGSSRSLRNWRR